MARVDYTDLRFPLRAFLILKLHEDEEIVLGNEQTGDWDDKSGNLLRVPYNYLRSFSFNAPSNDGGAGGSMVIADPVLGEVTKFFTDARQFSGNKIDILWGWQCENGQIKPGGLGHSALIQKLDVKFESGGLVYTVEFTAIGTKELYLAKVDEKLMAGCFLNGKPMTPISILAKVIDNYNNTRPPGFAKINLTTTMYGGNLKILMLNEGPTKTQYPGDNKPLIQFAMDLIKSTYLKDDEDKIIHFKLVLSSGTGGTDLTIKGTAEKKSGWFGGSTNTFEPLNTLYTNGNSTTYIYNKSSRSNILEMELNYEDWISMLGTSFKVGSVDKTTGKYTMVESDDSKKSKEQIGGETKKEDVTGGKIKSTLINMPTAETTIMDNAQSPEIIKKFINSMQSRMRSIIMNGSITVLGDPNIYDIKEHIDSKLVDLEVYDNAQNVVMFYSGKYRVTSWEHNIDMGRWTTKINITSFWQDEKEINERFEKNNTPPELQRALRPPPKLPQTS